ncbi:leucine-rich repeat domain-containing protein [uncultured Prevotella sp.]|uniref:leucine-rich repeat domain-containing protein n=1 Tax=uncultured Prevotella sp. TaxID=159272 RepID=UPI0027E38A25|nr:leucine-rich repeat domain-containing protein [uncultured Prevotella sp.]
MHNIKQLYSIHFGRAVVYTLLSLFLFMAGVGKAAAASNLVYKPQVKVISTNYTNSGTEVTLKLWMHNFAGGLSRFVNGRNVDLYIDDQQSLVLNTLWPKISNAGAYEMESYVTSGPVSDKRSISFNFKNIGTAQFSNLQIYQYSENDGKGTQAARWCTIELKLSFDNTFPYYGHKISVRGLWQDHSGAHPITEYVSLDNTIGGYVRPTKLKVRSFDSSKMRLSWKIQNYNGLASKKGSWKIYKCENGKREKIGGMVYNDNFFNFDIEKKKYNCSATYDVTFQPRQFTASDTICGLTTSVVATGHQPNADDVCQICNHSFFRYTTSDGKIVNKINNPGQFGANIVAHSVVDGKCVIEFDAPITKIPAYAFYIKNSLTGDLVIPNSVKEIGNSAFGYCTGFNGTLTLSNKLETIGSYAFYGCSGFKGSLILPNSLTTIGGLAFQGCEGFTELTLPNALSVIPDQAFYGCKSLSGNLVIPASVKEIGRLAFNLCTALNGDSENPSQITLPESLKKINDYVFSDCNKIKTIKFQSLPEGISKSIGAQKTVSLSDDSYISDKASGTVNEISYTRVMTSNWGTLVLPYPLKLTGNKPYRLYSIVNMTGEELVLKQLNGEVAAGTPCVVKRNGSEAELTFGANKAALKMAIDGKPVGGMNFSGTYWTKDVADGYIIAKDCFWNVEKLKGVGSVTAVKVGPFRAWLDGTSANAPAQLSMRIDGSTTGIDAIDALNDAEAEYYDLSGKRLDEPQRGVNIVRMKSGKTKKIIIK